MGAKRSRPTGGNRRAADVRVETADLDIMTADLNEIQRRHDARRRARLRRDLHRVADRLDVVDPGAAALARAWAAGH